MNKNVYPIPGIIIARNEVGARLYFLFTGGGYLGRYPPGTRYSPPGPGTPPGAVHAGRYGQQAGDTHPTGMHSCFQLSSLKKFASYSQTS